MAMKAGEMSEPRLPTLEEMQQWTQVLGRTQQLMLEQAAGAVGRVLPFDSETVSRIQSSFADEGLALWQRFLDSGGMLREQPVPAPENSPAAAKDRRFSDPAWAENPFYDMLRQSYLLISDYFMKMTDAVDGVDPKQKAQLRFATTTIVDAVAPSNFPLTNPQVMRKTIETGGENLVKGLQHMMADMEKGQLTHTDGTAFEVGRNIAATPGKVVRETPLYQLIHYEPTTEKLLKTPLVIFPPWINRFYILDLSPEKSFVKWAVDQGISVFMVSWKSADASMKDLLWDDYILRGQIDAIDAVRDLLGVPSVHTIGYCVAGTTLAATLALLAERGEADKVASATFFTAQVDFTEAGDLTLFIGDDQMQLVEQLSSGGFLDGRYMAATFNLLRGRDLIWNYVVNNYLLGQDYPPFDLLYWNGDTTNLPARWHRDYLTQLYQNNLLVVPDALSIDGTPLDLRKIRTPAYIQAGREDHIAPLESVWKLTQHLSGPTRFLLAGSGHIAGVVNPPASGKYQYWTCEEPQPTLEAFQDNAKETKGSWWPDWVEWIRALDSATVPVKGARKPGGGKLKPIEDAPGRYVKGL